MFTHAHIRNATIVAGILALAFTASLLFADYVAGNESVQDVVERFGYLGMLIVTIISGLNLFVPIPAATFTPIYVAAGFPLPAIILVLIIGTTIADGIGYLIGLGGKHLAAMRYPHFQERLCSFAKQHHALVLPFVFLYAALSPLPNEIILIPLAFVGFRFRTLLLPLVLGTIIYQSAVAYGAASIFSLLFFS